jgi:glycopeptide antibiotics resistance protein
LKIKFKNNLKYIKVVYTFLFIGYLLLLAYLTFFSQYYGREQVHQSVNLIPFRTIIEFLTSEYNLRSIVTNIAGNIIAFMPMGFFLPLVFKKLEVFSKSIIVALLATLAIEFAQYILKVGTSDVDDVVLNILGAIIGFWIFRLFHYLCINKNC